MKLDRREVPISFKNFMVKWRMTFYKHQLGEPKHKRDNLCTCITEIKSDNISSLYLYSR